MSRPDDAMTRVATAADTGGRTAAGDAGRTAAGGAVLAVAEHAGVEVVLAIDLGGSNLRAGVLEAGADPATVTARQRLPAPRDLDTFHRVVDELLTQASATGAEVTRVGLAVPGTAPDGRPRWVPKLPYLDDHDLTEQLGLPVTVANDAQLALLAEVTAGAAAGCRDVVLLAVGTGIGSAVLADGRVITGAHGAACSVGWLTLDPAGSGHPTDGWLERHAAGPSFDAAAGTAGFATAADLLAAALDGDARARAAMAPVATVLGAAIAAAVVLLDPELVLLAGGVAGSFAALEPELRAVLDRHTPRHLHGVPIAPGRFGPRAGLVGAAIAGLRGPAWREVEP